MLQAVRDPSKLFTDQVVVPSSYIIFGEDTDGDGVSDIIYAKNGRTGQIEFSGKDATAVIQNVIDKAPEGSRIFIKGAFTLRSIVVNKPLYLKFSGGPIIPTPGYNTIQIASSDVVVEGLKIRGGGAGYRLYIYKGVGSENRIHRILLRDIYIDGLGESEGFGLHIENVYDIKGYNIVVERCGEGGVHLIDSADVDFVSLRSVSAGSGFAMRIAGCGNVNLFSPVFDSSPLGLTLYNNIEVKIFGGITLNNAGKGIEIHDYNYDIQIFGHKVKGNGDDGIEINNPHGGDVRLIGVLSHNNGGYGFDLISCPNLFLYYCNAWGNTLGNINNNAGAVIRETPCYITKNSGVATVTGDGVTTTFTVDIAHGLVSDKVSAKITLDRDGSVDKVYLVDADGDGFKETLRVQVTYATAPADGETVPIYWSAEAVQ